MTYRRRYLANLQVGAGARPAADRRDQPALGDVPAARAGRAPRGAARPVGSGVRSPQQRIALAALAELQLADVEALAPARRRRPARRRWPTCWPAWPTQLPALSDSLSSSYLSHAMVSRHLGAASERPAPPTRTRARARTSHEAARRPPHAYAYGEPVSTSHHEAHLAPRDGEGQRTLAHDVAITPSPSLRRERFDYFGNRALHFSIREPHRALEVVATSVVDLTPLPPPPLSAHPALGDRCAIACAQRSPARRARRLRLHLRVAAGQGGPRAARLRRRRPSRPAARCWRRFGDLTTPHPRRLHLRHRGHRRLHPGGRGAAPPPRRLPGLRPSADRLPARAGPARPLRQRLPADPPAARPPQAGRRRRLARLDRHLRPRLRLGRLRPHQRPHPHATSTSPSPTAATSPTSPRSRA